MFRASLKAGIIMGIVVIVVIVIQYVIALQTAPEDPSGVALMALTSLGLLLFLVLPFASGILAARFGAAAALTTGAAAGAGALAGAITQIINEITNIVMNFIFAAYFTEPPGAPTAAPVSPISILIGLAGVTIWIAIAAGLGALGGIVGRAISARRGS